MRIKNLELWLALLAIVFITIVYLGVVVVTEIPPASGLFGHLLGVVGFVLMLMTEVLYSLRKRYQFARWGKMEHWLSFHIFTGLVGPYMVLLHTSWKFNGLAGILMLMTIIIVISGFVGRYFYTAIPRSVDGAELPVEHLHKPTDVKQKDMDQQMAKLATARKLLAVWHSVHIPIGAALFLIAFIHIGATLYYATLLR